MFPWLELNLTDMYLFVNLYIGILYLFWVFSTIECALIPSCNRGVSGYMLGNGGDLNLRELGSCRKGWTPSGKRGPTGEAAASDNSKKTNVFSVHHPGNQAVNCDSAGGGAKRPCLRVALHSMDHGPDRLLRGVGKCWRQPGIKTEARVPLAQAVGARGCAMGQEASAPVRSWGTPACFWSSWPEKGQRRWAGWCSW